MNVMLAALGSAARFDLEDHWTVSLYAREGEQFGDWLGYLTPTGECNRERGYAAPFHREDAKTAAQRINDASPMEYRAKAQHTKKRNRPHTGSLARAQAQQFSDKRSCTQTEGK